MFSDSIPAELLPLLPIPGDAMDATLLNGGLIHQTFRVRSTDTSILLQRTNTGIFPDPEAIIRNHRILHLHFQQDDAPFSLAKPLPFRNGQWCQQDANGAYWRCSQYIADTHTLNAVNGPDQAEALARFFATFTRYAARLDDPSYSTPIARFHDLAYRYQQFEDALSNGFADRIDGCGSLIEALKARKHHVLFFEQLRDRPEFPLRMMHHDAKLSNVLIDELSGQWICPIDLDTVMPGYYFSDLGDMIRSLCNSQAEDTISYTDIQLRTDLYESLVAGYLEGMADSITPAERKHIHRAGLLLIYMQTLRFLTDHLNGDLYYRIDHSGQNLERAQNQFTLLQELESYLNRLNRLPDFP